MKITQKKQKKREYIIEMTGKDFDIFYNELNVTKLKIVQKALARAIVEALRGMKNVKKYEKELDELKIKKG